MFKKKYSIGFCTIFALVSFLFLSPCCLAISKSDAFDLCRENCGFTSLFSSDNSNYNSTRLSYNDYLEYLENQTQNYYYVVMDSSDFNQNIFRIYYFDDIVLSSSSFSYTLNESRYITTKLNSTNWKTYVISGSGTSQISSHNGTFNFPNGANTFYMLYGNGEILSASFNYGPQTSFIPNKDYILTFNSYNNVNALLRNYSIYQWQIGETDNFSALSAFSFYLNDLTLGYRVGNVTYTSIYGYANDGALFYQTDNLYVNSRYMIYKHLYQLIVSKTYDNNETLEYYYFVFLPRDSVISNGEIISFGSGDYSVQDSTNALIDNENDLSAVEDLQAELLESGELIKRLDYRVYPNHSYDIIFALTQNIVDTLYYSGDTYIDIAIGDRYSHRFYASDFSIPINGLTYWIYMALTFGYCYLLYKQGAQLIHAIQEGDLMVLELEDADEYFYM